MLAAAQATGTQDVIAALYGRKDLPASEAAPEMRDVTAEESARGATEKTGAGLVAEAAGDGYDWADLKPAARTDDLQDLTLKLEEYLSGSREQLDVTLEGKNGIRINPYELAVKEFENPQATAESRKNMLSRIEKLLKNLEEKAS
jgi:hypothetical protein